MSSASASASASGRLCRAPKRKPLRRRGNLVVTTSAPWTTDDDSTKLWRRRGCAVHASPPSSSSYDDWGDARTTTSGREDWARRDGEDDFFFFDDERAEERTPFDDDDDFDFDADGDDVGGGKRRRARQRDRRYRWDGRRSRSREGSGYDASVNVLRLAYEALTSISAAFTKSLDVLLPSSVPMYVIRLIVAAGWCTFILASASRLVYGVVVIGAVLSLAVALGSNNGETSKRSSAWAYEYATDSSASGRRRREDFDELRRARMREERRRRGDAYDASDVFFEDGDSEEDVPTFTFDSRAFERGAEVFSETIASVRTNEAFRAAEDVTKEVRLWGDEALDEFKNAFNLNAGDYDFDFDADVADVEFKAPSSVKRERVETKEREDRASNVVEIIDVDALETRDASEVGQERAKRSPHVSFDDWLDTSAAPKDDERDARSTAQRDEPFSARASYGNQSSSAFRDAFADGFDVASAPTTARNWWNQFISGEFNGDFQADLIDVSFVNDAEEGREEEGDDDGA